MDADASNVYDGIGRRVREKRLALGWTLDDLAATSGVSRRMVVNVEQGAVNSSIGTLLRLSDALGIGIPSLVSQERVTSMSMTPRGHGTALWSGANGGEAILIAGTTPPDVVELWEWTLGPGDRHDSEAHAAGTREIAHVREGAMRIETPSRSVNLDTGDTLVFESDVDHAYVNDFTETTKFTLVVFEPDVRSAVESRA